MTGKETLFLGLGSNVGDRARHLAAALRTLDAWGDRRRVSSVYETEPVGYTEQRRFLNLVASVEVALKPHEVLAWTREIEEAAGRVRSFRGAPRTLDVDILLLGERVMKTPELEVPHPRMADRAFVLVPLLELAPGLREPGTGRSYADRLAELERVSGGRERLGVARVSTAEELGG